MAQSRFSCVLAGLIFSGLTGCAMTSDVMDTGNGTYMISGLRHRSVAARRARTKSPIKTPKSSALNEALGSMRS
jgi:hypothetical protein